MKKLLVIIFSVVVYFKCEAQNNIIYSFDSCVVDSLKMEINEYGKLLKKPMENLKLYALIVENDKNEFEIYLQEYSYLPKSGLLELIQNTNRKLKVNNKFIIPILIPSDKISTLLKKDKITELPLSGYYTKVVYDNYTQKVIQTAKLF